MDEEEKNEEEETQERDPERGREVGEGWERLHLRVKEENGAADGTGIETGLIVRETFGTSKEDPTRRFRGAGAAMATRPVVYELPLDGRLCLVQLVVIGETIVAPPEDLSFGVFLTL